MTEHVTTPVLDIGYEVDGPPDGPVAVAAHGWPDDVHCWDGVAPTLVDCGYRVLRPHLRGHGATTFRSPDAPRSGQAGALGHSTAWENSVGCAGWPMTSLPSLRTARGVPAALVVSTTHDVYSPAAAVAALARRIPGSVILRNDDSDHIGYLQSACVADAVTSS